MKKYSTLLILIFAFVAAPAGGVLQNSASVTALTVETGDVVSVTLVVWSRWAIEHAHDMGVTVNVRSVNGADVDHGTKTVRFEELPYTVDYDTGEARMEMSWVDTGDATNIASYSACATLVNFAPDNNLGKNIVALRGPESCTAPTY